MTQLVKNPFTTAYNNVDEISQQAFSSDVYNCFDDETGALNSFLGLEEFCDLGLGTNTGIDGIYWWETKEKFVAVCDGRVFTIDNDSGDYTEITGTTLRKKTPVKFDDNGDVIFMANGGKLNYSVNEGATKQITDTDLPVNVSHPVFMDSYIIVNKKNTGRTYYSAVNDYTDWSSLDFFSSEERPDNVAALTVLNNELITLGTTTFQSFYNDEITPFRNIDGTFVSNGISATYSLDKLGNSLIWLDSDKRVVYRENNYPIIISTPFDKFISNLRTVKDAIGMVCTPDNKNFYILTFPTENKTIMFNYLTKKWVKLGTWNTNTGVFDRFIGNCYAKSSLWNTHLVGSYKDSKIYKLSSNSHNYGDSQLRIYLKTALIDHGIPVHKTCEKLTMRIKRGQGTGTTSPKVQLRYRDNGDLQWSNYIEGNLGLLGDTYIHIEFQPMGQYISRQYELQITDEVPFVLVEAKEFLRY